LHSTPTKTILATMGVCDDDETSSYDEDYNFESNVGSRRYPIHDCCEFEDAESLRVSFLIAEWISSF
jgi:hypothetical protein